MSVDIFKGKQKIGILPQTVWGTPVVSSAAFKTLNYDAGVTIVNPDVKVEQLNYTSRAGVIDEYERVFVDGTTGSPTLNFSCVATRKTLALHLIAAMQGVTQGTTPSFQKVITMLASTGQIDFAAITSSASPGKLFTLAIMNESTTDGIILESAILNTLKITFDLNSVGIAKLVKISGSWTGRKVSYNNTLSGTWTGLPSNTFYNNGDTFALKNLKLGSTGYSTELVRTLEIDINNNLTVPVRTGGVPAQYHIMPTVEYVVNLGYNASTKSILDQYKNGDLAEIIFANHVVSTGSADEPPALAEGQLAFYTDNTARDLDPGLADILTAPAYGILTDNPFKYDGDYLGIGLKIRALSKAGGTPITAVITDNLDWGGTAW